MSTPDLHLQTLFLFNPEGRIISTREPDARPGPAFSLVRGVENCAWAMRADVSQQLAAELNVLAKDEPPTTDFREPPRHAQRYLDLIGGQVYAGPSFSFPPAVAPPKNVAFIDDLKLLAHFRGWTASEIPERLPMAAVIENEHAVSICFCARRSDVAAEAGLETALACRGRGLGPCVTAAWALAIRASGRIPLYSTSWSNHASLAVARKLGLIAYASNWSLSG